MAKIQMKMPEDFLLNTVSTRRTDGYNHTWQGPRRRGGQVVLAKVKGDLSSVIGKNIARGRVGLLGELEQATSSSPAKQKRDGSRLRILKVGFSEPRSDGGVQC